MCVICMIGLERKLKKNYVKFGLTVLHFDLHLLESVGHESRQGSDHAQCQGQSPNMPPAHVNKIPHTAIIRQRLLRLKTLFEELDAEEANRNQCPRREDGYEGGNKDSRQQCTGSIGEGAIEIDVPIEMLGVRQEHTSGLSGRGNGHRREMSERMDRRSGREDGRTKYVG